MRSAAVTQPGQPAYENGQELCGVEPNHQARWRPGRHQRVAGARGLTICGTTGLAHPAHVSHMVGHAFDRRRDNQRVCVGFCFDQTRPFVQYSDQRVKS